MGMICFDLDGTLADPLRAVCHCVRRTCEELGLPVPTREQVACHIGYGAGELFITLPGMGDPARLEQALEQYWTHFAAEGVVKYRIYDGVLLMLARLKRQGHQIYAVTVQPARFARQVLHQFDLLLAFDEVFGSSPDAPWRNKAEVIAQLHEQGTLQPGGYLVGDRPEDMAAAKAHGLIPVGVTYGFGQAEELRKAGAFCLFDSAAALDDWFKGQLHDPEIHDSFTRSE